LRCSLVTLKFGSVAAETPSVCRSSRRYIYILFWGLFFFFWLKLQPINHLFFFSRFNQWKVLEPIVTSVPMKLLVLFLFYFKFPFFGPKEGHTWGGGGTPRFWYQYQQQTQHICCLWSFPMVSCMLLSHGSQAVHNIKIFNSQGPHGYMQNVIYREVLEM
jgi:hypothetical protein